MLPNAAHARGGELLAVLAVLGVLAKVMLGAVLLGHSEHVRRTPDMHSDVFFFKFLPRLVRFGRGSWWMECDEAYEAWISYTIICHLHPTASFM